VSTAIDLNGLHDTKMACQLGGMPGCGADAQEQD
jgi:hypothetical protein